jgi:hypothetical protein
LVAYDGFDVPRADLGGSNSGFGWATAWQDLGSAIPTPVGGAGLTYPGLATSPGGATTQAGSLPDLAEYYRDFAAVSGGTMYVSCLMRAEASFGGWYILRFGRYPLQVDLGSPIGYYVGGLTIGDSLIVPSNVPTTAGQTALLVLRVQVNPGANQTSYSLYVNPTVGAPQPAFPSAEFVRSAAIALSGGVELRGEGGCSLDELRIGTTWESVLPMAAACYANCDGSTGAPVLNVNDFVCFQGRFAAGDTYANCDGSTAPPVLNVNDFICFQSRFAAGCP